MKKGILFVFALLFSVASIFAEEKSKSVKVDELYKIEWTLNTDDNAVTMKLFSDNTAAFDETYANQCIDDELESLCSEFDYDEYEFLNSDKQFDYEGKYTLYTKKFYLK